jgi:hypothetical protein
LRSSHSSGVYVSARRRRGMLATGSSGGCTSRGCRGTALLTCRTLVGGPSCHISH